MLRLNPVKFCRIACLLLAAVLMPGCENDEKEDSYKPINFRHYEPKTETTDEYTISYQYRDGTIVLDDDDMKYLVKVEGDSVLCFSSTTPARLLPGVGDIVSAKMTDKTPYGLGCKIIGRKKVGGMYRCYITLAKLDEIFEDLEWNCDAMMKEDVDSTIYDDEGNVMPITPGYYDEESDTILPATDMTRAKTIGHRKIVTLPLKPKGLKKNGVSIDGNLSLGALFHCDGNVKKGTFNFYVELIAGVEISGKIGVEYKKNIFQDIDEYPIFKLPSLVHGAIAVGPLVLRPYITPETYLDFAASGNVELKMSKNFSAKFGYNHKDGESEDWKTKDDEGNKLFKKIGFDGNISVGLKFKFDVGMGVYTENVALELVPEMTQTLSADFRMTGDEQDVTTKATLNCDINIGASGGLIVKWFNTELFHPELKFLKTNIFHYEVPFLPQVDGSSFNITSDPDEKPLRFDARYNMKGGLLSLFTDIYPGIAIYRGDELVYKKQYDKKTELLKILPVSYSLDGLNEGITYTAKPFVKSTTFEYESEGMKFSSRPPGRVTSIVAGTSVVAAMEYDHLGRLTRIDHPEGYTRFTYEPLTMTDVDIVDGMKDDILVVADIATDNRGFITSMKGRYDDGEGFSCTLKYDQEGHLTSMKSVYEGDGTVTNTYTWRDGNIVKAVVVDDGETTTMQAYYEDTPEKYANSAGQGSLGQVQTGLGFFCFSKLFGERSRLLPKSISTKGAEDDMVSNLSYTFNGDGTIDTESADGETCRYIYGDYAPAVKAPWQQFKVRTKGTHRHQLPYILRINNYTRR